MKNTIVDVEVINDRIKISTTILDEHGIAIETRVVNFMWTSSHKKCWEFLEHFLSL